MYHKIIIVGHLGRDPEMRYTQDGTPVTNFSVATSRKWTRQDGTQVDETIWFRVTAWKRQAETCNEYLQKGRQVLVEGQLVPDPNTGGPKTFTRRDGTVGAAYEVRAFRVLFLGGRGEAPPAEMPGATEEPPAEAGEEIPF
ncbi:MAG: single-stranded DNA-binding protein [Anaerolineae bacterium]|nr:single-stranded DNA-binding protein [Anaerolineae bacterium]